MTRPRRLEEGLTIRSLRSVEELELFGQLSYVLDPELKHDLTRGLRRREWMWVALRSGRVVARASWWGSAGGAMPSLLDFLDLSGDVDRVEVGVRLLEAAFGELIPTGSRPPEYVRFVPPNWREDETSRRLVEDLMTVVRRTGGHLLAERFRFEWRPATPIPEPAGRLTFRSVRDEDELLDLMTRVLPGTLDAHSRGDLVRLTAREAAAKHYQEELAGYTSPREWWLVATLPTGEPVGFVCPARNDYGVIIAYIGVLPGHRGRGYVDDILAEGTRLLAAHSPPRIRASTDLDNVPMAKAFARAGWVNFERCITMAWE